MRTGITAAPTPGAPPARTAHPAPVLRRCACGGSAPAGGECEECRKKRTALQRSATAAGPGVAPPLVHEVVRSPGQPLDDETRRYMEPRFGHSFADVRIHADARAADSAAAVRANAYAFGRDIVFGAGKYAPGSAEGRRLIAHELTHVVQQGAAPAVIRRDPAESRATGVTERLLAAASTMEQALARAERRDTPQAAAAVEQHAATVMEGAARIREIAAGSDEALKARVLAAFSLPRLREAEARLRPVPESRVRERTPTQVATQSIEVGSPTDGAEIEADRVAAAVVQGGAAHVARGGAPVMRRQFGEALVAAGGGLLITDAELAPVTAPTGPPGWVVVGVLGLVGVALVGIGYALTSSPTVAETRPVSIAPPTVRARPRKPRRDSCNMHMTACMLTSLADHPGSVWGQSRCVFCAEVCRRNGGVWPQSAPTTNSTVRCDYWNF
ncbi:MAG TPA: DUF4157 domain-containing protein [Longimicrobium sp.]|nr:DUF4157 domain-containing protein [Longimicrobium sp.]